MWILDKFNFDIFIRGNLRINVLIVTVAVLMCYIDVVQGACDCEIECSCSKSNCTVGEYWLSGAGCVECPAGHFCLGNETAPKPCPLGTASSDTGATNSSFCRDCASGFNSTAGSLSCTPCPAGYDCVTSPGNASLCGAGNYSNYREGICLRCPSGKVCLDPTQQPQYCPGGYEPDASQTLCNPCNAGKFSYNGTSCQACDPGSYSLKGYEKCTVCPVGHQ
ncbi:PREDICTED: signal peptide, CUB and EGF-like domain-containing protein 3 [Acropora digitifera]|uniref:signal peptide, CUB and EGF-like domain-containing protein 3 n=1 Tax=Acropora digitifera TaxID=70779 RepID=UPI00077A9C26|nr:PREDICTED: signal peptide, CUB and EGF-like domain-containing protein 3 [Acropora digitifera]